MDISKYSVVDPRIVQHKAKYAVEKGALSITNATFQAIANSSSQQTFQVQVPSENVFVDRAVDWVNTVRCVITLPFTAAPPTGAALLQPGVDFSLAPFPVHQSVNTMTATINDQTVTVNTSDVLPQILRLADLAKTRAQRTCPTMLDRYWAVQSTSAAPNSPVSDYATAYLNSEVGNGAWGNLKFYVPGQAGTATCTVSTVTGVACPISIDGTSGLPKLTLPTGGSALTAGSLTVGVEFTTAEKLVLPPFIFADEDELSTGLFGVQNIQFTANFSPSAGRSFRLADRAEYTAAGPSIAWDTSAPNGSPFTTALLQLQFLTPSLDVPLPSKSIVPWMEFPRYISPTSGPLLPNVATVISSQTITLSSIPDLLVLYVKTQQYTTGGVLDPTQCDWSLPISKISVNFDNFSGLLANHSQYELYKMSVNNGIDMDFNEWSGQGWVAPADATTPYGQTALVGGPLVLRPGRDFALSTGMAPGLVGNFTLQFDLTVNNYTGVTYGSGSVPGVSVYTVAVNSGFFETMKGSSRILKGVVTEQDILGAPVAQVESSMERLVGAARHGGVKHKKHGMHAYMRA